MRHNGRVNVVYALVGIVVVIVIALLAVGRFGELPAPSHDRPPLDLPDGAIEPRDIDAVRFAVGVRGYRMDEVDEVLDRVADDLATRDERIDQLERVLALQGLPIPPVRHEVPELSEEPLVEGQATD